jgi:hypothetical protein
MKNTRILLIAIIAILFSCQKDLTDSTVTPTAPKPSSSRPKTYTENYTSSAGHDSITFNLSYDANGRLISMISASSPGDKFIYQYSGNTITLDLYNANALNIHANYFLNPYNYIDSSFQYNDTKDTSTEKYLYNTNKQLVTLKQYDYSTTGGSTLWETTNYSYDSNGNLIKEANSTGTITYQYSSLLNTLSIGFDFLPTSKYFPGKTIYTSSGSTVTAVHTYTFDSSNRLTSEKIVADNGEILIKSYTY